MNNFATRMMMTAVVASMACAPVIAQAKTRAGDSNATYSTSNAKPGIGRDAKGENAGASSVIIGLLAAIAVITGGLVAGGVISGNDDKQSPGT